MKAESCCDFKTFLNTLNNCYRISSTNLATYYLTHLYISNKNMSMKPKECLLNTVKSISANLLQVFTFIQLCYLL